MDKKDFFDEQNAKFFTFLNEMFELKKNRTWKEISQSITLFKIKRTYRVFAELFPRKYDYVNELKKCKDQFSCIHYSTLKGRSIIDEVVRFSLYSEKILVFHPLQNPAVTNQSMNPGRDPKSWMPDFLEALHFYIVIQKWVAAGVVKLIVNPYDYDLSVKTKLEPRILERAKKIQARAKGDVSEHDINEAQREFAEQLAASFKDRDKSQIVKAILQLQNPVFTVPEAQQFADQIIQAAPDINPLYSHLNIPLNTSMVMTTKGGGPLESILFLTEVTGGHIYTPKERTWEQLKEFGSNEMWTKINQTFFKIPLSFLNNVDTAFALEIRKENKLSGVRTEIRKLFSELSSIDIKELTESKFRDLHDCFKEEIKRADAEWSQIQKQATTARAYWFATSVGVPIVTNEMSLIPLALTSAAWLIQNESTHNRSQQLFRKTQPISMFIDLKNKRQTFFSELKNCLL